MNISDPPKLILETPEAKWFEDWATDAADKKLRKIKLKAFFAEHKKDGQKNYVITDGKDVLKEHFSAESLFYGADIYCLLDKYNRKES